MPVDTAAGKSPIIATSVVIRQGRSRFSEASFAASMTLSPSTLRRRWKYVTTRMASCTAMPKMDMKPIAAETEKCIPVTRRAKTPPAVATGMLKKTIQRVDPVLHGAVNEERR